MPGPARQHPHLALLRGSRARPPSVNSKTYTLSPLHSLPAPPGWLDLEARREWARTGAVLIGARLLTGGALPTFEHYCRLYARLVREWASEKPPTPALLMAFRALSNSLGLLGLNPPSSAKPANRFANNSRAAGIP
jgi:phage terminase small subunit